MRILKMIIIKILKGTEIRSRADDFLTFCNCFLRITNKKQFNIFRREIHSNENKIKKFFKKKGFCNIYIYGYGPIGKLLYGLLKNMNMFQVQAMDKNADNIQELVVVNFGESIDEGNKSCMIITVLDLGIKEELDIKYQNLCKYFVDDIF